MKLTWIVILTGAILITGCAANRHMPTTPEAKMAKADSLFAHKKYARAAELYDQISFEKKSLSSAVALMRLADSYFEMNKFTDARLEYAKMTTLYPDFSDIQRAWYRIGVCYYRESLPPQYDQTETLQSIEAFRTFVDKFPSSSYFDDALDYIRKAQNKLITKKYYNGFIYYRMQDYSSALMYFNQVTELGNTDKNDRLSLYYTAKAHLAQKNKEAAKLAFDSLKTKYPDSKEAKRLAHLF